MNLARERRSVCRKRDLTRIPGEISLPCGGRASVTRFHSGSRAAPKPSERSDPHAVHGPATTHNTPIAASPCGRVAWGPVCGPSTTQAGPRPRAVALRGGPPRGSGAHRAGGVRWAAARPGCPNGRTRTRFTAPRRPITPRSRRPRAGVWCEGRYAALTPHRRGRVRAPWRCGVVHPCSSGGAQRWGCVGRPRVPRQTEWSSGSRPSAPWTTTAAGGGGLLCRWPTSPVAGGGATRRGPFGVWARTPRPPAG